MHAIWNAEEIYESAGKTKINGVRLFARRCSSARMGILISGDSSIVVNAHCKSPDFVVVARDALPHATNGLMLTLQADGEVYQWKAELGDIGQPRPIEPGGGYGSVSLCGSLKGWAEMRDGGWTVGFGGPP